MLCMDYESEIKIYYYYYYYTQQDTYKYLKKFNMAD